MRSLIDHVSEIRARAISTSKISTEICRASAPVPAAKNAVLPVWPEAVRGVPNSILRSALFGVGAKRRRRRFIKGERIASLNGVEIAYTGEQLDQGDLDVFITVLHAVRTQELGSKCRVTSYALLKMMGKTDTGKNRATLHDRITRLVACALTVKQCRYTYIGSLIAGAAKDEITQEWVIELDPKMRDLFAADQFTQFEWGFRQALAGQPLAQWLHSFYSTHAQPYTMKVETLHKLCGSEAVDRWKFAQTLRGALDALSRATSWKWEIDENGLVHVETKPKPTQSRHLVKKMLKNNKK